MYVDLMKNNEALFKEAFKENEPPEFLSCMNKSNADEFLEWSDKVIKHVYDDNIIVPMTLEESMLMSTIGMDMKEDIWGKPTTYENEMYKIDIDWNGVRTRTYPTTMTMNVLVKEQFGGYMYTFSYNTTYPDHKKSILHNIDLASKHAAKFMKRKRRTMLNNIAKDNGCTIIASVKRHSWYNTEFMNDLSDFIIIKDKKAERLEMGNIGELRKHLSKKVNAA
jgi:hypothetical protein